MYSALTIGDQYPRTVHVIVEIPKRSKVKYERCKKTNMMVVDRILPYSMVYPHNYGYIQETLAEDGDPLDVFVLMNEPIFPGTYLKARPIAMIDMVDSGEPDHKIIAVCEDDPTFAHVKTIEDVAPHFISEVTHFLEQYKPPGKVRLGPLRNMDDTYAYIQRCHDVFKQQDPAFCSN